MKLNPFHRSAAPSDNTELNITPFLSLMVVLIPVLLVSVKFSLLAQYDIYSNDKPAEVAASEHLQKEKISTPYRLVISEDSVSLLQGEQALFVDNTTNNHGVLPEIFKDKVGTLSVSAALFVQLESSLSYQGVVTLLDVLNQYPSVFSSVSLAVKEEE